MREGGMRAGDLTHGAIMPAQLAGPGGLLMGGPTIIRTVAAVANAFFNITGRRIKSLPMTAIKYWRYSHESVHQR